MHDLPDAIDVGIGLGVDEAGYPSQVSQRTHLEASGVGFVALQPERDGKGMDAELAHGVFDGCMRGSLGSAG